MTTQVLDSARRVSRPADPGWRPAPEAELAHLRLCWGQLYRVSYDAASGCWEARYLGSEEQMTARSPLDLRRMIRDDWNARQPQSGWSRGGKEE